MGDVEIVFVDVETTGFGKDAQIVQIAACTLDDSTFNVYITPTISVHPKASEITGFELRYNKLFLHGKRVRSRNRYCGFGDFIDFLKSFNCNVILIAHNCFGFDMPRILDHASDVGLLDEFQDIVDGFSDSLVILKSNLKDVREGKGAFTLKSLVQDYLPDESTDDLHNAERDVELLMLLLCNSAAFVEDEQIIQTSKTINQYFAGKESKMQVEKAKESLDYYSNIVPAWVINKMATAKIDSELLRETYQEDGFQGIRRLFSQNYYGKPCVTNNIKIVQKICNVLNDDLQRDSEPSYDTDSSSDYYYY